MFASDDTVFVWAIGKALLIVIVSAGFLIYAAWWAVAWQRKNTPAQQQSLEVTAKRIVRLRQKLGWM